MTTPINSMLALLSALLTASLLLLPASVHAAGKYQVVSVLEMEASSADQAEANYWYEQIIAAVDGLAALSTRRDPIPGLTQLPHRDYEQGAVKIDRNLQAAHRSLRQGRWVEAVRLAEQALTMAARFDSPPLPGDLLRDLYLLQSRALLVGGKHRSAREAMQRAIKLDPYWEPTRQDRIPCFPQLFRELHDEMLERPSGTLAVIARQKGTQIMVHGVTQGWSSGNQLSLSLPVGTYKVTARGSGFADRTDKVTIRKGQRTALHIRLNKGASGAFHPQLMEALASPRDQRSSPVWTELDQVRSRLGSDALLTARFDTRGQRRSLSLGLFMPGRQGWSFYRRIPLQGDMAQDSLQINKASEELLLAIDRLRAHSLATR